MPNLLEMKGLAYTENLQHWVSLLIKIETFYKRNMLQNCVLYVIQAWNCVPCIVSLATEL